MKKSIAITHCYASFYHYLHNDEKPAYIEVELGGGFTQFSYDMGKSNL